MYHVMLSPDTAPLNPRLLEEFLKPGETMSLPASLAMYSDSPYGVDDFPLHTTSAETGDNALRVIYQATSSIPAEIIPMARLRLRVMSGRGALLTIGSKAGEAEPVRLAFLDARADHIDIDAGTAHAVVNLAADEPLILRKRIVRHVEGECEVPTDNSALIAKLGHFGIPATPNTH